jgi:hypothetical protein
MSAQGLNKVKGDDPPTPGLFSPMAENDRSGRLGVRRGSALEISIDDMTRE